jgi:phosphoribulokinase
MTEELNAIDLGVSQTNKYKIHPSVIINILDIYYRNNKKDFVLGILLGTIYPDYVSVNNVIFVPCEKIDGEQQIFPEMLNKLLEHNSRIYNDTRVGW